MADPTAQMGFQVGSTALKHGTEYVEQNVGRGLVHDGIKLMKTLVQPIRQLFRSQTLLQCLEFICCQQALSGPVSLEAQALVSQAVYRSQWPRRVVSAAKR